MKKYEEIYEEVKRRLSYKRFNHCICTMKRAEEYAKKYKQDQEKIKLVALTHDIAREIKKEDIPNILRKYNVRLDEMEKYNVNLSHSKIGAQICKKEFGFDNQMCNAIRFHTTGRENMSMMEKILFVADATGEDRHYENTEKIYKLALKNIDLAIIEIIKDTIQDLSNKKRKIHLNTIKTYNYYIKI